MAIAIILIAILILIGVVLRARLPVFGWLHIPASVIAGFIGLALVQLAYCCHLPFVMSGAETVAGYWSDWPKWLIVVVFAGMLLAGGDNKSRKRIKSVAAQGVMVWVIVLGEAAVGLLAVWLLVQPLFGSVPNSLGMLIETGFAGGHGTAAAMGEVFAHPNVNLEGGKDLGMLMATFGLVYGVISGVLWINLGFRFNWFDTSIAELSHQQDQLSSIGIAKISSDTVDPLLFQMIWLVLAFGIGLLGQHIVMSGAGFIDGFFASSEDIDAAQEQLSKRLSVSNLVDFPLFIYALFGGLLVRKMLNWTGNGDWIDPQTIERLTSAAMDVLVVAAIASLNLSVVMAMAGPFLILFVCGAIWTAICLLVISRWLLPREYWFQLGLINYGMSTGTTATGFVLLKMVDPQLKTGAATDYALAAPLSAPFVGGGMITIALPLLLLERIPIAVSAIVVSVIVVCLIYAGTRVLSQSAATESAGTN